MGEIEENRRGTFAGRLAHRHERRLSKHRGPVREGGENAAEAGEQLAVLDGEALRQVCERRVRPPCHLAFPQPHDGSAIAAKHGIRHTHRDLDRSTAIPLDCLRTLRPHEPVGV